MAGNWGTFGALFGQHLQPPMTRNPKAGVSAALACAIVTFWLVLWPIWTKAQRVTGDALTAEAAIALAARPFTAPWLTNASFRADPMLSRSRLPSFQRSYASGPEHICAVAIGGRETDEYVSTTEGAVSTCYWMATMPNNIRALCTGMELFSARLFDCPEVPGGLVSSLFFIARGDSTATRSLRIKLNSTPKTLGADLPLLLDVVARIHQERRWEMPADLVLAIARGEDVATARAGIEYRFSREFGEIPRYNLSVTFAAKSVASVRFLKSR